MFYLWLIPIFALGACVGGVINYCFYRLPLEKSLLWPGPRCGRCWQPIRWFDNVPLLSYILLRGRCRTCGGRIPAREFVVELGTGLLFAGLFYAEIDRNLLDLPYLRTHHAAIAAGTIPRGAWVVFLSHAALVSFLLLTSLCDLDDMTIPLPINVTGTLLGLVCSMLFPWPYPDAEVTLPPGGAMLPPGGAMLPPRLPAGLYPWPVWYPLPDWLPPGSWQLGLATGLTGALAGIAVMRVVRFLYGLTRGIEGLGIGDADLMMMAGTFVGWQPIVLTCFVAAFPGLLFGAIRWLLRGDQALPFGPSLALGVMMTLWLWPFLGDSDALRMVFFDPLVLGVLVAGGAMFLLLAGLLFRLVLPRQVPNP
ncbi:MAG TPA: prepilin peptidase [Gemmataceae bacterium]|jgi:leader peptidase (prepilin peptidase)/N-methyltransferase